MRVGERNKGKKIKTITCINSTMFRRHVLLIMKEKTMKNKIIQQKPIFYHLQTIPSKIHDDSNTMTRARQMPTNFANKKYYFNIKLRYYP